MIGVTSPISSGCLSSENVGESNDLHSSTHLSNSSRIELEDDLLDSLNLILVISSTMSMTCRKGFFLFRTFLNTFASASWLSR